MRRGKNSKEILEHLRGRLVAECGENIAENVLKILVEEAGGARLAFPSQEDISQVQRNEMIRSSFDGKNYEELASRWGLTARSIRRIIHGK